MSSRREFWNQPDVVARFAARDPDVRLTELLPSFVTPSATRVLDVGCAGGRNTVLLAERGFDVYAVDLAQAMVVEVRRRIAPIVGAAEAERRVREGDMQDLSAFASNSFDLVVALGVLQQSESWREWEGAVAELTRLLRPGGRLLVSHFTPDTDLTGEGVRPVAGERHVYEGLPAGRAVLLHPAALDAELARYGFVPEVPTGTGATELNPGRRVSANGLYRKRG